MYGQALLTLISLTRAYQMTYRHLLPHVHHFPWYVRGPVRAPGESNQTIGLFNNVYHFGSGVAGLAYFGVGMGFIVATAIGGHYGNKMYRAVCFLSVFVRSPFSAHSGEDSSPLGTMVKENQRCEFRQS
jgi:hypothetical protein